MTNTAKKFYRLKDLPALTGLSKAAIEYMVSQSTFPQPFKISERAKGWLEDDIVQWQQRRLATRGSTYRRYIRRNGPQAATHAQVR